MNYYALLAMVLAITLMSGIMPSCADANNNKAAPHRIDMSIPANGGIFDPMYLRSDTMEKIINPDAIMRPAPFWSWNDKLCEGELQRQIREMAAKGWGGYFMHARVGLVTGYLSDEWMELIRACADEAQKTGTYAWLYDEDKWPSGFAGGMVPTKSEAYRSRALVLIKAGTSTLNDTILAKATYNGIDYEVCRRVSPLGDVYFNGTSYVDLMNPEAVKEFINCTHEAYKNSCGDYFGNAIPGIFTDEPCYLMYGQYNVPVVPWSDYLPDFFQSKKGYSILDHLPELFLDINDYRKTRFDFYDSASELFKENFTKQYYDWCTKNGLIMTGHFMAEDSLWYQTQWSGDVMSHYEFMHWPGIDKLGRHIQQVVTVKQVSSAVDQLGKERAFSEVYGCMGGQASFFHRKWIGDWQAALGISFVNHHLSLYSMRGERKRDYPANLFYQQPWWDDEREFADYQARLCALVSEGTRQVDVLVLQPLASVWSEYSPIHSETGFLKEREYDDPFDYLSRRLLQEKIDFHYGNESLMAKYGSIEDGSVRIGNHVYNCILIPPASNIKSSTLNLLFQYAKSGGKIIVTRNMPSMVDGMYQDIQLPGAQIAATCDEAIGMVSALCSNRIRVTDLLTGTNAPSALVHARQVGNSLRYLIINSSDKRELQARIDIPSCNDMPIAILDLYTGEIYRITNMPMDVNISPAGSLVIICGQEANQASSEPPAFLKSGVVLDDITRNPPTQLLNDLKCTMLNENTLLLNDFILDMNGAKVYEGPICNSWHRYFYPAKDGTPFRATYTFDSEDTIEGCFAAIEVAENLDHIYFNGKEINPCKKRGEEGSFDPDKSWLDINFTKVYLPPIKPGINTLVIEGKKSNNITGPGCHAPLSNWREHNPTEAEEVYICGKFTVKSLSEYQFVISRYNEPAGYNITCEGFPFYCGKIKYSSSFRLGDKPSGKVYMKLNGVPLATASAEIRVNGKLCAIDYWQPMLADISKAIKSGNNKVEVILATTLVNAFGPNRMAGIKESVGIGPHSFIDMGSFKRSYELFDYGLESIGIYVE